MRPIVGRADARSARIAKVASARYPRLTVLTLKPARPPADSCEMVITTLEDGDRRRIDQTTMAGVGEGRSYASARDSTARETSDGAVEPDAESGRWEWDITAGVIRWSAQMCRIYGVEPGVQRSFEEFLSLVHPDDRTRMQTTVHTAYETRQPYSLEHRIIRPDGVVRLLHAHGEVISDDAQRPLRMLGTGQDITAHAQKP